MPPRRQPFTRVKALGPPELRWISQQLVVALNLASHYSTGAAAIPTLHQMDAILLAWLNDSSSERIQAVSLIDALGVAFGQYLSTAHGLEWATMGREDANVLLLAGDPGGIRIVPAQAVSDHLEAGEFPFFVKAAQAVADEVESRRRR